MSNRNRSFKRPSQKRELEKIYVVATEGEKTEKIYFEFFNGVEYRKKIQVKVLPTKSGKSSPQAVVKRLQKYAIQTRLKPKDELWVVIDDDGRPKEQLQVVANECNKKENYFLAISNPCFELWLLLHQENPKTPYKADICEQELTRLLGKKYNKSNYDLSKLIPYIGNAIRHAKRLHVDQTEEIPSSVGTHVYLLVEKLIKK